MMGGPRGLHESALRKPSGDCRHLDPHLPPRAAAHGQAHGHASATWGARKPNQPESLDEGLDVTRLGAKAGHTGQQDRTDTWKTSGLRVWLQGPQRRPGGDHGLAEGWNPPGWGRPDLIKHF